MKNYFSEYLRKDGVKETGPRKVILNAFLKVKGHISADELYSRIRKIDPSIGQATVFRFMKVLVRAGLAQSSGLGERQALYEPQRTHHDHLICTKCGKIHEFKDDRIEAFRKKLPKTTTLACTIIVWSCMDCAALAVHTKERMKNDNPRP